MSMEVYEKSDAKYGIAVKKGTNDVPNDGRFHVIVDGGIVASTSVEAAALIEYHEQREARMAKGRQRLEAERIHNDAQRFKNDVLGDKAARKSKQGGRGKGGVKR
jgi:hypothetical protein